MNTPKEDDFKSRFAFGLTDVEVRRLQDILRRECGVEMTMEASWARAIELLALFRMLVGSGPEHPHLPSSNTGAIDVNLLSGND